MTELSGWGRYPRHDSTLIEVRRAADISKASEMSGTIARGAGRAYGDAAIGEAVTFDMRRLDRLLDFDEATGLLTAQAGVMLSDIIATFLPRGFFPLVVPGTKFVSVGGMIAANVHGKNHHKDGGFGDHVVSLKLALPSGEVLLCSEESNTELFDATIGGMGLTGTILEATFRMRRIETGWVVQRNQAASNLAHALELLRSADESTYSVAWIDCLARGRDLGRSLIFTAEHASLKDLESDAKRTPFPALRSGALSVPLPSPLNLVNRHAVGLLNRVYFARGKAQEGRPVLNDCNSYFFPLDGIGNWNLLYGRHGFVQHQAVLPSATAAEALEEMIDIFSKRATPSFLAVLKRLGPTRGTLSFPFEGVTLALDLPVTPEVFGLLDEIDRIVVKAGGRLYLAKDARQSRETFESGYQNLDAFRALRNTIGATGKLQSRQSLRLGL